MTPFERDIDAQAQAVERVVAHYAAEGAAALDAVRSLAAGASQVVFVAMGSSRSAALPGGHDHRHLLADRRAGGR